MRWTFWIKQMEGTLLLMVSSMVIINGIKGSFPIYHVGDPIKTYPSIREEDFCKSQNLNSQGKNSTRSCDRLNRHYLKFFFSLFMGLAWGAWVRTVLRLFKIAVPYTVVLMISGLIIGLVTTVNISICEFWSPFTKIARTPPELILYTFLPILIFESAFSMKSHLFFRSLSQIILLGVIGTIISFVSTAIACQRFLPEYKWTFTEACLFGSIISATDPVTIVAVLRERGTSEMLNVMIEGESLLNGGMAILLYQIFKSFLEGPDEIYEDLKFLYQFIKISVGGPVFGFCMAKIAIIFLSQIFNDAATEITITLATAYLTYFVAEFFLGVSGVFALVVLGITLSSESTSISPEVEGLVHHFWQMLSYFTNTVLFLILGTVSTETAIVAFDNTDLAYICILYLTINLIRMVIIFLLSPFLSRLGYGVTWKSVLIIVWVGLRGTVGILLSLDVYKNKLLCEKPNLGPKFLLQTAGVVFLTLFINGTTTNLFLDTLGFTEVSLGKQQNMRNALRQIMASRARSIAVLKRDRLLADSDWQIVELYTNITNPYEAENIKREQSTSEQNKEDAAMMGWKDELEKWEFFHSQGQITRSETYGARNREELYDLVEDARLRMLKAMKISIWHQFERGQLGETAVQTLTRAIEQAEDIELTMVHMFDLKHLWTKNSWTIRLKMQIVSSNIPVKKDFSRLKPKWRKNVYRFVSNPIFGLGIFVIIIFDLLVILLDMNSDIQRISSFRKFYTYSEITFTFIYFLEFLAKSIALGAYEYWKSRINIIDGTVTFLSILQLLYFLLLWLKESDFDEHEMILLFYLKNFRLFKFFRLITIIYLIWQLLVPVFKQWIMSRINSKFFDGYEICKGYLIALDDTSRVVNELVSDAKVQSRLTYLMKYEKREGARELGLLATAHPEVAVGVKTRHASRCILNQMRASLTELKELGANDAQNRNRLLDEKEFLVLTTVVEAHMKQLWKSPVSLPELNAESVLWEVPWINNHDELHEYLRDNGSYLNFSAGTQIYSFGDLNTGIYVILSGIVKTTYSPTIKIKRKLEKYGKIPAKEVFPNILFNESEENILTAGSLLGELSFLTGDPKITSAMCETNVRACHLSHRVLKEACKRFYTEYNSLLSRIWRSVGLRLTTEYLRMQSIDQGHSFQGKALENIKIRLEASTVPIGKKFNNLTIPKFVSQVFVIYGQIRNLHNVKEFYTAPTMLPKNVVNIVSEECPLEHKLLLVCEETIMVEHQENLMETNEIENLLRESSQERLIRLCLINSPGCASFLHDAKFRTARLGSGTKWPKAGQSRHKSYVPKP